ncbi:membrane-anchored ubiquitin-fold protein 1 [Oryza brachyantha]|uniref:Membrane-anchored ubiquitin-fold protein n=1 Tax=Oryza brachyantha TaxID=4533 RepID=J3LPY5_ORYBR|nr:membrane-anchored ubiquitin-fold protein 1 [Oryza brachyantha]XP_015690362.1 membrane-anchored ubiquitin-fold protein 1 [Oryza brachyantha]
MSGVQEQFEIKFRLPDGTDIGPKKYPAASSVATLKESIIAQWPKDKEKGPRTVNDIKLINAGKILENNKTLSECKSPICDFSGMTTMHVVVHAPTSDKQSNKIAAKKPKDFRCGCSIM